MLYKFFRSLMLGKNQKQNNDEQDSNAQDYEQSREYLAIGGLIQISNSELNPKDRNQNEKKCYKRDKSDYYQDQDQQLRKINNRQFYKRDEKTLLDLKVQAEKSILASKIIKKIIEERNKKNEFKPLRLEIIQLIENYPIKYRKNHEYFIKFFTTGVRIELDLGGNFRIDSIRDGSTEGNVNFIPTRSTTGCIFYQILKHKKKRVILGQYGTGKTHAFLMFYQLSDIIIKFRIRLSQMKISVQDLIQNWSQINFEIPKIVYWNISVRLQELSFINQQLRRQVGQMKEFDLLKKKDRKMQRISQFYYRNFGIKCILLVDNINILSSIQRKFKQVTNNQMTNKDDQHFQIKNNQMTKKDLQNLREQFQMEGEIRISVFGELERNFQQIVISSSTNIEQEYLKKINFHEIYLMDQTHVKFTTKLLNTSTIYDNIQFGIVQLENQMIHQSIHTSVKGKKQQLNDLDLGNVRKIKIEISVRKINDLQILEQEKQLKDTIQIEKQYQFQNQNKGRKNPQKQEKSHKIIEEQFNKKTSNHQNKHGKQIKVENHNKMAQGLNNQLTINKMMEILRENMIKIITENQTYFLLPMFIHKVFKKKIEQLIDKQQKVTDHIRKLIQNSQLGKFLKQLIIEVESITLSFIKSELQVFLSKGSKQMKKLKSLLLSKLIIEAKRKFNEQQYLKQQNKQKQKKEQYEKQQNILLGGFLTQEQIHRELSHIIDNNIFKLALGRGIYCILPSVIIIKIFKALQQNIFHHLLFTHEPLLRLVKNNAIGPYVENLFIDMVCQKGTKIKYSLILKNGDKIQRNFSINTICKFISIPKKNEKRLKTYFFLESFQRLFKEINLKQNKTQCHVFLPAKKDSFDQLQMQGINDFEMNPKSKSVDLILVTIGKSIIITCIDVTIRKDSFSEKVIKFKQCFDQFQDNKITIQRSSKKQIELQYVILSTSQQNQDLKMIKNQFSEYKIQRHQNFLQLYPKDNKTKSLLKRIIKVNIKNQINITDSLQQTHLYLNIIKKMI